MFYRGLTPSLIGIIPYAGIDLTVYEVCHCACVWCVNMCVYVCVCMCVYIVGGCVWWVCRRGYGGGEEMGGVMVVKGGSGRDYPVH